MKTDLGAPVKAAGVSSLAPGTAVQTGPLQVGGMGRGEVWNLYIYMPNW